MAWGDESRIIRTPDGQAVQERDQWDDVVPPWTPPPASTPPQSVYRLGGQFAQGLQEPLANLAGLPVDLVAAGMRGIGIPVTSPVGGSESIKRALDYASTLPGRLGDAASSRSFAPLTDDRTYRSEPETRAEKIARGLGEGIGSVPTIMLPAAAAAQRLTGTGQAIAKVLASQPAVQTASGAIGGAVTGATDNPYLGMAAGIAAPAAVSRVARKAITPITNRLLDTEKDLVDAMKREGIPALPSQATGSRSLRAVEETMARMPLSGPPMEKALREQRQAFNRAVMSRAGVEADNASPQTMDRAFSDLGAKFDDLSSRTTVRFDGQFSDDVRNVANEHGRRLSTDVAPVFKSYMDDLQPYLDLIAKGGNPMIPGEMYKNIRSSITRRMRSSADPELRDSLGGLVESLDGAMARGAASSVGDDAASLVGEWNTARRQYANLMTIDRAVQGGTAVDRTSGNIPLGALTASVRAADRSGFTRGRSDLGELARVGDYIAARIPNSGTPERMGWRDALSGAALFGVGSGVGVPEAIAAAATPWAVSRAYTSGPGQRYLSNQLLPGGGVRDATIGQAAQQAMRGDLVRALQKAKFDEEQGRWSMPQ